MVQPERVSKAYSAHRPFRQQSTENARTLASCLKSLFGSPSFQTLNNKYKYHETKVSQKPIRLTVLSDSTAPVTFDTDEKSQKPIRLTVLSDLSASGWLCMPPCLKSLFGSPSFQTLYYF